MSLDHGYYLEDLSPGMEASVSKTVTNDDITAFAELSGDINPVHLNEEFAAGTVFKKRIAHGFLTGSLFSTVLGTKLPGPGCIYVSQNLKFKAPVKAGDTVEAHCTITALIPEKKFITLQTQCIVAGKVVVDGEATIMVPSRG